MPFAKGAVQDTLTPPEAGSIEVTGIAGWKGTEAARIGREGEYSVLQPHLFRALI
jgi:hypothetical protein